MLGCAGVLHAVTFTDDQQLFLKVFTFTNLQAIDHDTKGLIELFAGNCPGQLPTALKYQVSLALITKSRVPFIRPANLTA